MTTQIRAWLDNAVLQSVAESYLHMVRDFGGTRSLDEVLKAGVNNLDLNPSGKGATRLTDTQIAWFRENYEIITHYPNDPSGFSATLFKNKATGAYTLSFRSTEYELQAKGGDWERDGANGADGVIKNDGMAVAQLSAMESFYANLKQGKVKDANGNWVASADAQAFANDLAGGKPLNVTGYSLGAHMATSFTLLHWDEVTQAYAYNAAGVGVAANLRGQLRLISWTEPNAPPSAHQTDRNPATPRPTRRQPGAMLLCGRGLPLLPPLAPRSGYRLALRHPCLRPDDSD